MDEIAADWIFENARVLTQDPRRPFAAALAIAGGRVAAAGGRSEVRRWRGRGTRVVDAGGATVVPGLVDAHAHLEREGLKSVFPSLARCRSIADIQDVIRRLAARTPKGEWIVTMPVGAPPFYPDPPATLAERRWPTRADLDAAAPDHPVYVRGIWGYWNKPPVTSIANSRALAAAGITRDTPPPPGVEIARDARGEPTGLFVESNLIQVIEFTLVRAAPRFTHALRLAALRESQRVYAARGVTAIYEGHGIAPEVLAVYREAHARGALGVRATLALSPTWEGARDGARALPDLAAWAGGRGLGDGRLRVGGICLHFGGDPEVARVLHASQPYTGWAGFVESANAREEYTAQATLAARLGLRVNTLVTRCLPEVLEIWEKIAGETPIAPLRWVLVHLGVATADQLARIRRLGVVATTNPISYLYRSGAAEAARAGAADTLLPHRSLARLRIPFGIATDNKPANPWWAFVAVVDRRDLASGTVLGARERLTRAQALAALTTGGAYVTFAERDRGRLTPGYAADLAVLEHDPLTAPLETLVENRARLTMVGGEVVYGDA
ncbi:MAG TPA: amidohydrolase family protein [Methylomirabilota bacterium]|nr:amidohydrolase family protein [Methylomirabilota bacterium]